MELIKGSGWRACFDEEKVLYTARTSVPGAIKLFEITKEVFDALKSKEISEEDKYSLIHDKGRMLYMDIDDRCGPPYTVVLDSDYKTLCPWADLPERNCLTAGRDDTSDAAIEIFPSQANNREQRRKKREERNKDKE